MFAGALIAIAVTMALALIRALLGPSVYDRVLAVNMFGTKTVLLLSVVAYIAGRSDYLDLALAYALINFLGVWRCWSSFVSAWTTRKRVPDHRVLNLKGTAPGR